MVARSGHTLWTARLFVGQPVTESKQRVFRVERYILFLFQNRLPGGRHVEWQLSLRFEAAEQDVEDGVVGRPEVGEDRLRRARELGNHERSLQKNGDHRRLLSHDGQYRLQLSFRVVQSALV